MNYGKAAASEKAPSKSSPFDQAFGFWTKSQSQKTNQTGPKQKKQELLTKVREGRAICSSLEDIPGSAKEDKHQIVEVDAIRLEALKAIQDVLDL